MSTLLELEQAHLLHTYNRSLAIVRGQGSYVWDLNGKQYLDFTSGISVCNLGHCHPAVTEAITRQASRLVHCSNYFINEHTPLLAQTLAELGIGGRSFFANSGAEANEGMIKFARRWGSQNGGRSHIVCMNNSFHGRTLGTLAATGRTKYREGFGPDLPGFSFATFNDLASVRDAITPQTVAVMLETVQGEGGVIPASREFLTGLRQLCDERQLLLLADEIQCGMGRTGTWFAFQRYGVRPDAMTIAKAIANGVPMGVFQIRADYADVFAPGTHGTTFGGNPLASAAARATIDTIIRERLIDHARDMGRLLLTELNALAHKHDFIRQIRGLGLMLGLQLASPEMLPKVTAACRERGLLVLTAGEDVIRLMPPLNLTADQLAQGTDILSRALATI